MSYHNPATPPRKSATFDDHTMAEIRRAAATGIYDIRGGGAKRKVPHFDDLLFLGASISRYPLEGYREACDTSVTLGTRYAKNPIKLDIPITIASGMPSRTLPSAIAAPLPCCSPSRGCSVHSPHRFRCFAPLRERNQFVPLKIAAPASSAKIAKGPRPADTRSPMSSVATTAINTPPPKPITAEIMR